MIFVKYVNVSKLIFKLLGCMLYNFVDYVYNRYRNRIMYQIMYQWSMIEDTGLMV